jgi:hypothetical protein
MKCLCRRSRWEQAKCRSDTAVWQQTAGRQMQGGCYFEAMCQLRGLETDSLLRRHKFNQADYTYCHSRHFLAIPCWKREIFLASNFPHRLRSSNGLLSNISFGIRRPGREGEHIAYSICLALYRRHIPIYILGAVSPPHTNIYSCRCIATPPNTPSCSENGKIIIYLLLLICWWRQHLRLPPPAWRNSPQWARTSSLSRLHDDTRSDSPQYVGPL